MKLFIAYGVCAVLYSSLALAQSAKEILGSPDWSKGSIVTDGAAVYKSADFDSPVVDYLGYHVAVYILKKPVPGRAGMGLFHRIRYKSKAGYVADTDVRLSAKEIAKEKKAQVSEKGKPKATKKLGSQAWNQDDEAAMGPQPVYFTRYMGASLGLVNFTEKFSGKKLTSKVVMGGLRLTGPGVLFDGPPIDVNLWFTYQTPAYYNRIATDPVKGFLLMGDVVAMFPILDNNGHLLSFGLGGMWTYTNYKVAVANNHFDSQEIRLGFDFDLGFAQRIKKVLVRGDVKYFWEKTQYLGYMLSVQGEY